MTICPPSRAHGTSCTPGVDKKLAFQFVGFKFVRTTPKKDINVHVSCSYQQAVGIPWWDDCMTMSEANT